MDDNKKRALSAALTQIESRQKPIRLIDERPKPAG